MRSSSFVHRAAIGNGIAAAHLHTTGVARNFNWERSKLKKNFVTFFGDIMVMTSLK